MPLPASGAINLLQIRDELAPGNAAALALDYYRGRTYSIAGGGQRTISNSPQFSEFYSLQAVSYRLDSTSYVRSGNNTASIELGGDTGFYASSTFSNVRTKQYDFVTGDAAANYDVRCSITGGVPGVFSAGSEPTDQWAQLNVSRIWTRSTSGPTREVFFTLQIRRRSDSVIVASASMGLIAAGTE